MSISCSEDGMPSSGRLYVDNAGSSMFSTMESDESLRAMTPDAQSQTRSAPPKMQAVAVRPCDCRSRCLFYRTVYEELHEWLGPAEMLAACILALRETRCHRCPDVSMAL